MYSRDYRDIAGGALLLIAGLWVGIHSMTNFEVGQMNRMGPGMFPAVLGFLLAGLGVIITLPAFFRAGEKIEVDWRPLFFIVIGVLAFGLTVAQFGMIPAIMLLTVAGVFADNKLGVIGAFALAIALSVIAFVIFRLGLGIVLEPFRWPF